jgi:hypothetical protein
VTSTNSPTNSTWRWVSIVDCPSALECLPQNPAVLAFCLVVALVPLRLPSSAAWIGTTLLCQSSRSLQQGLTGCHACGFAFNRR